MENDPKLLKMKHFGLFAFFPTLLVGGRVELIPWLRDHEHFHQLPMSTCLDDQPTQPRQGRGKASDPLEEIGWVRREIHMWIFSHPVQSMPFGCLLKYQKSRHNRRRSAQKIEIL